MLAQQEHELILLNGNKPVAKVVGMPEPRETAAQTGQPRKLGRHPGIWEVSEDFDAPLPDEFWLGQE